MIRGRRASDQATIASLPMVARAYVVVVVALGAASLAVSAQFLRPDNLLLTAILLALAVITATAKIELPLGRSQSNLSLSQAVTFWALFAIGPAATTWLAAVSALAQSTLRAGRGNQDQQQTDGRPSSCMSRKEHAEG